MSTGTWVKRLAAGAVGAPWLAWGAVRAFGLEAGEPAVLGMAFTPYAALTSPLPVVVAAVLRRWGIAALAALAAVALIAAVLPRAVADVEPTAPRDGRTLTVMSLNLDGGHADSATVMRLARTRRVDVLSLQEVGSSAIARLDAASTGRPYPSRVLAPKARAGGSALLARRPLHPTDSPSGGGARHATATLAPPGAPPIIVETVHPPHPTSDAELREWRHTLDELPTAGESSGLRLLAGDFNATLDHRELRRVIERGYVDAAAATGSGLLATWPNDRRRPLVAIDHILVDRRIAVRRFEVHDIPATDHRAVIAELGIPRRLILERTCLDPARTPRRPPPAHRARALS